MITLAHGVFWILLFAPTVLGIVAFIDGEKRLSQMPPQKDFWT